MPKQKKKLNAFMIFAMEVNKRRFNSSDYNKAIGIAGRLWNKLSKEKKEEYKIKAQKSSEVDCVENSDKKEPKEANEIVSVSSEINKIVTDANSIGDLDETIFYFINASSFFEINDEIYPAEIALAKFSLKSGIIDDLHVQINPGELPLSSIFIALEKSKNSHKYLLPPDCGGVKDYYMILDMLISFLLPLERLPIFFTEGNIHYNSSPFLETRKVFEKIFYEAQEFDMQPEIKIYPIEELFYALHNITVRNRNDINDSEKEETFPSIAFASDTFFDNNFRLISKSCEFHDQVNAPHHCCLSKVRSYGYTIAKWCSDGSQYPLIDGKHSPHILTLQ
ncbi:CLUMA_CG012033, isoform A [Clunio marinus]|uniref:CLUMA_CG012033, isoform A n=1 Tax=Clunio marinus TaxID=568069 RepID=A0A1J1IG91_9DIPT|nr:CLUMA_CG012033, isoform A [Clunio marinus]